MPYLTGFLFSAVFFAPVSASLALWAALAGVSRRSRGFAFLWRIWLGSFLGYCCAYAVTLLIALAMLMAGFGLHDGPFKRVWILALLFGPFLVPGAGFFVGAFKGVSCARRALDGTAKP